MITVLHVITGLRQGGAEQTLARLCTGLDRTAFRCIVAPLRDGGYWAPKLRDAGIEVVPLRLESVFDLLGAVSRLRDLIKREKPDVVQSWLYHADLVATLATGSWRPALAWNLRNSDLGASGRMSWSLLIAVLATLSGRPNVVIANAGAVLVAHRARGYHPRRSLILPNGVDLNLFRAPPDQRASACAALGLPADRAVIGMPARFEGFKDHGNFLNAARIALAQGFNGVFALAGSNITQDNAALRALIAQYGMGGAIFLLGPQADMPRFYAALDVMTLSSSHGEGFPNVIAEAMACGVPVAATDVGDVRAIVGATGRVVAPRDPAALAAAWTELAQLTPTERADLASRARARIAENYSLDLMLQRYAALYADLATAA